MKIYKLSGEIGTYFVCEVIDIEGWYLTPINNSYEYEKYSKKLYTLEIIETESKGKVEFKT